VGLNVICGFWERGVRRLATFFFFKLRRQRTSTMMMEDGKSVVSYLGRMELGFMKGTHNRL
jgi:hypothetical protein